MAGSCCSTSCLRAARARSIKAASQEVDLDVPFFNVNSKTGTQTYYPLPNTLIHVTRTETGSRVRVYENSKYTAEDLFTNPDPDPTNVGTCFEAPTFDLWKEGENGDDEPIEKDEFIIRADPNGVIEDLYPPIDEPFSKNDFDRFEEKYKPNPDTTAGAGTTLVATSSPPTILGTEKGDVPASESNWWE